MMKSKAVVVLSGGQDSTTCLYWAKSVWDEVEAVTFWYGQRHLTELEAAKEIAAEAGVSQTEVDLRSFGVISRSALTDLTRDVSIVGGLNGLPSTFTPGRNLVFLTMAASFAIGRGSADIVTGVCETDYSGYPDCRADTILALQQAIRLGNDLPKFTIHTPLMFLSKADTVRLAVERGAFAALKRTVTCYHGQRPGCGTCPACSLRAKGFSEAGVQDPAFA